MAAVLRTPEPGRTRVVRIIARLNVGGPAIQAITLSDRLQALGYETILVRGREEPDEGSMDHIAERSGVRPVLVPSLRRNPGWHDLPALFGLIRIIRRERPHIVHTHAAKGGTLGRLAAIMAFPRRASRPLLIHTYHGHSLTGYFSPRVTSFYRLVEQVLARRTDRLIAVSEEVRNDLVALRVAPASQFEVLRLGFDLSPFAVDGEERTQARADLRAELGIPPHAWVVTLIARLVPIKRVDRFLAMAAQAVRALPDAWFLVVGDGELREALHGSAEARELADRLVWTGFRRDMPAVCFASDVVTQTSDNEGTPVALIEAQAAGVPVVSTDVGGTRTVVDHGVTGLLVAPDDVAGLCEALQRLSADSILAATLGRGGRQRCMSSFSLPRLVADVDRLYRGCLRSRDRPKTRFGFGRGTAIARRS